jgi:hypothetical protein
MQNRGFSQPRTERRHHPRFECEGKAEIRTPDSPAVLWGLVTDLSATGCYIELPAPLQAGKNALLTLTVLDVSINVEGRIAVVHPMFGMGVAFSSCPPAEKQKLQRVLSSLSSSPESGFVDPPGAALCAPADDSVVTSSWLVQRGGSGSRETRGGASLTSSASAAASGVIATVPAAPSPTFRLTPQVACAVLDQIVKHIGQRGVLTRADLLAILHQLQAGQR